MTDTDVLRNLDTQGRLLAEVEAAAAALLEARPAAVPDGLVPSAGYAALTRSNDALREERGWEGIDLLAALTPEQRARFDEWNDRRRAPWGSDDLLVVGLAAAIGIAATGYDEALDSNVGAVLGAFRGTERFRRWERAGKGLPIDHTGPGFGGPAHRVRSSGHDVLRVVAALQQIMRGEFVGFEWENHRRYREVRPERYVPVDSVVEALGLWAQHLAADLVTPMSLPLPGWTWLNQLPLRSVRKFAHDAYRGDGRGGGLNLRSGGITPSLPLVAVEAVIRTHVHARAAADTGSAVLSRAEAALRDELLLASHALVAAASCGRAALPGSKPAEAVRHVNVPVLVRTGWLAIGVYSDAGRRSASAAPDWNSLAADVDAVARAAGARPEGRPSGRRSRALPGRAPRG